MPNVPQDIPVPHTLVLDLEKTLVSSSWDRKYGWRHAKRPGVDKFLLDMAQYYEIVLYTPSLDGIAEPVINNLDKHGCIMHRLYRDATYYYKGVHVKDLNRLNRNIKKMIVLDDDPSEVQFNLENLIRVKPYTDPHDRTDNTLERITPFLIEIVREGHDDIPALLKQYEGMDADEIANEQDRRVEALRSHRQQRRGILNATGVAGAIAGVPSTRNAAPELPPAPDAYSAVYTVSNAPSGQLTSKDIVGAAAAAGGGPIPGALPTLPGPSWESDDGITGWLQRRTKEKQEHQMRKFEKWNDVMMRKHQEKHSQPQNQ
jgi:mitochondrial import inner membrane translocase subunit TIM50